MIKIGDFSRICRVPVSALRYYADIGLLEPAEIDPFTGYRYYSIDQLPRLNRILALKDLGLSLPQIKAMLHGELSAAEMRGMLKLKQAEIADQIRDEQARLKRVEARLQLIEQEGQMPEQEVVLKSVEPMHILSLRQIVPDIPHMSAIWGETWKVLQAHQLEEVAPCLSLYYDEDFTGQNMDVEFAYVVASSVNVVLPLDEERKLTPRTLPGLPQVASMLHVGDYDTLDVTYETLGRWVAANGYQVMGVPREVYLKGGGGPEALTEIQFPVEKVG